MALTWNRRARKVKERKQQKLLEAQKVVVQQKEVAEKKVAVVEEKVKAERAVAVEARQQQTVARTQIDRAKSRGLEPEAKHVAVHAETEVVAKAANAREVTALQELKVAKEAVPAVPQVPAVDSIALSRADLVSIALFVLLDVFKLNKWVAFAVVGVGAAALYFAEKQGWTDFINF
jgi:hypothetical protein